MKGGTTGSRLLSTALCALIALLVLKLGLTIMGAFRAGSGESAAIKSAIAKEQGPQNKPSPASAPRYALALSSPSEGNGKKSLSALDEEEKKIRIEREQIREEKAQLEKLKKDVELKIKTLLALQKQTMLARGEQKSTLNAKVQGLAKIYGTMKPKQAAKLMGSLDDALVKSIISTMPPDKAASILALMDVKKAAKISEAISGQ